MRFLAIFILFLALATMVACGKKPGRLDAPEQPDFTATAEQKEKAKVNPEAKAKDTFPKNYPKPWL